MRKYHALFALIALLITQQSFAVGPNGDRAPLKECENIAKACISAGFVREGGPGKNFWHDCMKPVLMGQTVSGVTIDPKDVTACKQFKMKKMQKELKQLEQPPSKTETQTPTQ